MFLPYKAETTDRNPWKSGAPQHALFCSTMSEGAASRGSFEVEAPPKGSSSSKKSSKCMCNWADCENLRIRIIASMPTSHPWCKSILQFQSAGEATNRKIAIRHSISHHLHLSGKKKEKKTYYIYPHHFSEIGWQRSLQKTSYIDQSTAKEFDDAIGRKAYVDNVNSVERILQCLGRPVESRDKGMNEHHAVPAVTPAPRKPDPHPRSTGRCR